MSTPEAGTSLLLNIGSHEVVPPTVLFIDGDPTNTAPGNLDIIEGVTEWTWLAVIDLAHFGGRFLPQKGDGDIADRYKSSDPKLLDGSDAERIAAYAGVKAGTHLLFEFRMERPSNDSEAAVRTVAWMVLHNLRKTLALRAAHDAAKVSVPKAKIAPGTSVVIGPSPPLP